MYWSARTVAEYVADRPEAVEALRTMERAEMVGLLKNVPWTERDKAAAKGTEVHAIAEKIAAGATVEVPEPLAGYIDSCVSFLDDWRPAVVLSEATIGNRKWHYAGTLDLVADLPDGRRALLDYKTSASGIWPETALQLSAYRHAEFYLDANDNEIPFADLGISCAYAVWLRADGYDVIPVDSTCNVDGCKCGPAPVFDMFLHVAYVAKQAAADKGLASWVHEAEQWRAAVAA
jgi:hypothetical protein